MYIPHNSGEALCSFTMAPCVVVERLEGKQQCSRAPVGEHADQAQDAECGCHKQQEVNEKRPKPCNNQSHNHDSAALRQDPLFILVRGRSIRSMARSGCQPRRPYPERIHIFAILAGFCTVSFFICCDISYCTYTGLALRGKGEDFSIATPTVLSPCLSQLFFTANSKFLQLQLYCTRNPPS